MPRKTRNRRGSAGRKGALKKAVIPKKFFIALSIAAVLGASFFAVKNYIFNSRVFIIEEVELRGPDIAGSDLYDKLTKTGKGGNIFSVNIAQLASSVKRNYFEVRDITIHRIFPNKLLFYIETREPVAQIDSKYYYTVDKEGVILRGVSRTLHEGLPLITGVSVNDWDIGTKCASWGLEQALELLEELSRSGILESHNISEIKASDGRNIFFYMDEGLEVKIGGENFRARLKLLKKALGDPAINPKDVRYIDLRFKDIVIKPK